MIERPTLVLVLAAMSACLGRPQAEPKSGDRADAVRVLQRYIQLRLQDADWKVYSKLITWPDEPSWDCKWVASKYKIGAPVSRGEAVVIPVVYGRVGLFCYDFNFKSGPQLATIDYELVRQPTGWKVNAPIPDYPDIGGDTLIKWLDATSKNARETPERRAEAEATVRKIREAIKVGGGRSPKPPQRPGP